MSKAWTCISEPQRHGSFLQIGLDNLTAIFGAVQPIDRYACPVCLANRQPGWMRPATQTEVGQLSHQLEGA